MDHGQEREHTCGCGWDGGYNLDWNVELRNTGFDGDQNRQGVIVETYCALDSEEDYQCTHAAVEFCETTAYNKAEYWVVPLKELFFKRAEEVERAIG